MNTCAAKMQFLVYAKMSWRPAVMVGTMQQRRARQQQASIKSRFGSWHTLENSEPNLREDAVLLQLLSPFLHLALQLELLAVAIPVRQGQARVGSRRVRKPLVVDRDSASLALGGSYRSSWCTRPMPRFPRNAATFAVAAYRDASPTSLSVPSPCAPT